MGAFYKRILTSAAISMLGLSSFALARKIPTPPPTPPNATATATQQSAEIEAVFVLDNTGSMAGLIQTAKEKIWSIATSMTQAQQQPIIRLGLVGYRDRGDSFVTQVTPLSTDIDSIYSRVMAMQAKGGGDTPEDVNQALFDAVNTIQWSSKKNVYRVIFLVGDCPPHMDYQQVQYPQTAGVAAKKGIVINTIKMGNSCREAIHHWKTIAQITGGEYTTVDQQGGGYYVKTPYDQQLSDLADSIDATRCYYGSRKIQRMKHSKLMGSASMKKEMSTTSKARRAIYNNSGAGAKSVFGSNEFVQDVSSGKVKIKDIKKEELPPRFKDMSVAQIEKEVQKLATQRKEYQAQINKLQKSRSTYITEEREKAGMTEDASFSAKTFEAIKKQSAEKGIMFDEALEVSH